MSETKTFWVQISAGHGPAECELAVVKTLQEFLCEAAARSCSATVLQREAGAHPGTARSVLIAVTGVQAEDWLRSWEGISGCHAVVRERASAAEVCVSPPLSWLSTEMSEASTVSSWAR
jgi:protein subunit release factor B